MYGDEYRGLKPAATPKSNYGDSDSTSQNDDLKAKVQAARIIRMTA
jgi:hypothetical protein